MTKMLVFDMDGTIADLYGFPEWLANLQAENAEPYEKAEPLFDMDALTDLLKELKNLGWKIAVTTWLAKDASKDYNKSVTYAKKEWLAKHNFPYDEIHCVKYGTTKANCTRGKADFQILVDDNRKILDGWTLGAVIEANADLLKTLETLKSLF